MTGFSHYYNFRNDIRAKRIIHKHGIEGYGIYWSLLEELYVNFNNLELDFKGLSDKLQTEPFKVESIIINFGLFEIVNGHFKSNLIGKTFNVGRVRLFNINVNKWYDLRNEVFKRDNYTCSYCNQIGGKLEADHVVAFSRGGLDELNNLTTSCRRCNRQKKDKSVDEFIKWKQKNGKTLKK